MLLIVASLAYTALGATDAEVIGYYSWNWGKGSAGSAGANNGVAFTGLVDVASTSVFRISVCACFLEFDRAHCDEFYRAHCDDKMRVIPDVAPFSVRQCG